MAAELAREIIEQSRPFDRATRAVIKIQYQDRYISRSLKITTPIVDGAQVFQLDFTLGHQEQAPLRYNASLDINATMCIRNDDGSESPELFRWCLHPKHVTVSTMIDQMLTALLTDN
eukprot:scaffold20491_cov35-Cyclotella_meneghiniana.AAC.7